MNEYAMIKAAPSPWQPIEIAPRDGTIILLCVHFQDHALEDNDEDQVTLGTNYYDNTGDHEWRLVGWDWQFDEFREAPAEVISWMPMPAIGELK